MVFHRVIPLRLHITTIASLHVHRYHRRVACVRPSLISRTRRSANSASSTLYPYKSIRRLVGVRWCTSTKDCMKKSNKTPYIYVTYSVSRC